MYWRQAVLAAVAGAGVAATLWPDRSPIVAVAAALVTYIMIRVGIATAYRVRYWYSRGTRHFYYRQCPTCNAKRYRFGGDWILRCGRCGWVAGLPVIRWLTQSVPMRQLRRSMTAGRTALLVLAAGGLLLGPAGVGAISDLATSPAGGGDTGSDSDQDKQSDLPPVSDDTTPTMSATPTATEAAIPTGDADGDGLNNRAELQGQTADGYPLPDADPYQKDVYLIIYHETGADGLTSDELDNLRSIYANMPVDNPGEESGIRLHVTQKAIESNLTTPITESGFDEIEERVYEGHVAASPAACTAYVTVLVEKVGDNELSGRGSSPGYLNMVARGDTERYDTEYSVRTAILTHELLHNLVGELPSGRYHTQEGWLGGGSEVHGTQFYMSNRTASALSDRSFTQDEYYEDQFC